jgi:hypothetical protein
LLSTQECTPRLDRKARRRSPSRHHAGQCTAPDRHRGRCRLWRRPPSCHHPGQRADPPDRDRGRCQMRMRLHPVQLDWHRPARPPESLGKVCELLFRYADWHNFAMRYNQLAELIFGCTEGKTPNVNARTHCHQTSKLTVIAVGFGRADSTSSRDHSGVGLRPLITTGLADAHGERRHSAKLAGCEPNRDFIQTANAASVPSTLPNTSAGNLL